MVPHASYRAPGLRLGASRLVVISLRRPFCLCVPCHHRHFAIWCSLPLQPFSPCVLLLLLLLVPGVCHILPLFRLVPWLLHGHWQTSDQHNSPQRRASHSALIPSYGCSSPQPSSAPSASHTSCRILLPELASRFLRCHLHLHECSNVSRSMSCRAAALLCSLPGPPLPGSSLGSRSLSQWEDLCWALHEPAGLVLRWGSQLCPM